VQPSSGSSERGLVGGGGAAGEFGFED